jgi:hypothetical protein
VTVNWEVVEAPPYDAVIFTVVLLETDEVVTVKSAVDKPAATTIEPGTEATFG